MIARVNMQVMLGAVSGGTGGNHFAAFGNKIAQKRRVLCNRRRARGRRRSGRLFAGAVPNGADGHLLHGHERRDGPPPLPGVRGDEMQMSEAL